MNMGDPVSLGDVVSKVLTLADLPIALSRLLKDMSVYV
jgi:hypothetical protein